MLSEMTSEEMAEWYAFYNVREEYREEAEELRKKAGDAKKRAKENNS